MLKTSKTDKAKEGQKERLKRKGVYMYNRYFYNPADTIRYVCDQHFAGESIDDDLCEVVFDVPAEEMPFVVELILYYPKKLKELHYVDLNILCILRIAYGETLALMKEHKTLKGTIRSRLQNGLATRAKETQMEKSVCAEDIILPRLCPYFLLPINYGAKHQGDYSATVDRIDSTKGYVPGNIQVISFLANRMKNSASLDQLITFANGVTRLHGSDPTASIPIEPWV